MKRDHATMFEHHKGGGGAVTNGPSNTKSSEAVGGITVGEGVVKHRRHVSNFTPLTATVLKRGVSKASKKMYNNADIEEYTSLTIKRKARGLNGSHESGNNSASAAVRRRKTSVKSTDS